MQTRRFSSHDADGLFVYAGDYYRALAEDDSNVLSEQYRFNISWIAIPDFYSYKTNSGDVAMLRTSQKFQFSQTLGPICLPKGFLAQTGNAL